MAADFGTDWDVRDDINPNFPEVTGNAVLAGWLVRLLSTSGLWYDPTWGIDLRLLASGVDSDAQRRLIVQRIRSQLDADDRIDSATVSASFDPASEKLFVTLAVVTAAGPFRMVLAITDVSVSILSSQGV